MYYLAIDIGASSGRHILGEYKNGKLVIEEMYRFPNGMKKNEKGTLVWDTEALFHHIKAGISACVSKGKSPDYIGIDTWGVDFVLLDENGKRIGDAVGYRDKRTEGMDVELYKSIPEDELYTRTGIQKAMLNTIYQLQALKMTAPEQLESADTLLMMPDYLGYLLTGVACSEYTIATTGQLVKAGECDWDYELIERMGLPAKIFKSIKMPGYVVGPLLSEIQEETGCKNAKLILPPSHDTASAVVSVPTNDEDVIYISSGTWSLIGVERLVPDTSEISRKHNFTNEGGIYQRYRYLKNITGLWMVQSMKKELGGDYTFDMLCNMAKEYDNTPLRIDPNDDRFTAPDSMIAEVKAATGKEDLTIGEMFSVVYHSLADAYKRSADELEELLNKKMQAIHIVGGGCKDDYLCALTARATGKPVYAGPIEATAIGNLVSQMLSTGVFKSLPEARVAIFNSFDVKKV